MYQSQLSYSLLLACILSHVQVFATPLSMAHQAPLSMRFYRYACWSMVYQAPLSMGFSRQAHWSGLPFHPPGDLPDPGIELASPALQADFLPVNHQGRHRPSVNKKYYMSINTKNPQTEGKRWP